MTRNPFIIPGGLDGGHELGIQKGSIAVGGNVVTTRSTASKLAKNKPRVSEKNPYSTPIVQGIRPPQSSQCSRPVTMNSEKRKDRPATEVQPSHIGALDMLRVREAERAIMSEEDIRGRHKRDVDGRILPGKNPPIHSEAQW